MSTKSVGHLDFDAPQDATQDTADSMSSLLRRGIIPINNRAVFPDGSTLNRAQILERLGLNPGTPPDAWLNIIGCGSNASALTFEQAREVAITRSVRAASIVGALGQIMRDEEQFVAGGEAPSG